MSYKVQSQHDGPNHEVEAVSARKGSQAIWSLATRLSSMLSATLVTAQLISRLCQIFAAQIPNHELLIRKHRYIDIAYTSISVIDRIIPLGLMGTNTITTCFGSSIKT